MGRRFWEGSACTCACDCGSVRRRIIVEEEPPGFPETGGAGGRGGVGWQGRGVDAAGLGGEERGAVVRRQVHGHVSVGIGRRVQGFGFGGVEGWFAHHHFADGT